MEVGVVDIVGVVASAIVIVKIDCEHVDKRRISDGRGREQGDRRRRLWV